MSKNILKNKRSCVFILLFVLGTSVWLGGCDTAYKYDITDGIDNNGASEPDITIDTEGGIDVSMYEKARIFPGLVDTAKEERINATIELDLNKQYIDSITLGVSKVNVNTECQLYFQEATRKYIEEGKDQQGKGFDPRKLLAPGAEAIKATVREKIELFGSANKA